GEGPAAEAQRVAPALQAEPLDLGVQAEALDDDLVLFSQEDAGRGEARVDQATRMGVFQGPQQAAGNRHDALLVALQPAGFDLIQQGVVPRVFLDQSQATGQVTRKLDPNFRTRADRDRPHAPGRQPADNPRYHFRLDELLQQLLQGPGVERL